VTQKNRNSRTTGTRIGKGRTIGITNDHITRKRRNVIIMKVLEFARSRSGLLLLNRLGRAQEVSSNLVDTGTNPVHALNFPRSFGGTSVLPDREVKAQDGKDQTTRDPVE
jgi:hypothetical protein